MIKLIALGPACTAGRTPLNREELLAKAGVMSIIGMETNSFKEPENIECAYIRFFAREVEDYLSAEGAGLSRAFRVTADQRREAEFRFLGARSELNPDQHSPCCRPTRVGRT